MRYHALPMGYLHFQVTLINGYSNDLFLTPILKILERYYIKAIHEIKSFSPKSPFALSLRVKEIIYYAT